VNTEDRKLLEEALQEFRLLRQTVERIETRLASAPAKVSRKSRQPEVSEAECKKLYAEIGEEYAHDRTTRKLDALLARPKSDLSLFCSVNNLPVDLHNGKASIRDQILARIREDEQLTATYPMPSREPAYLSERKK
jgi:hypothetical protein